MSEINTGKISGKLEGVIDFRIGTGASKRHPIILQGDSSCPATDGTQIFLPRREAHFSSERDNELSIANSTAHEADHIKEFNEYFGAEVETLRKNKVGLVTEFHQINYSDLTENPALAGWIDNIVKDRRIDAERRKQLPGVKRYYEETLAPSAEYFRPSVNGMSELDAIREQYLQRALIGKVIEPVPAKHRALLEEMVSLTLTAGDIREDKRVVTQLYQLLKENFDITQPISRLPALFGTGDHSKPSTGSSQNGYGSEVKPREGREGKGKKPKNLADREGKSSKPNGDSEKAGDKDKDEGDNSNRNQERSSENFYPTVAKKEGMEICIPQPRLEEKNSQGYEELKIKYAGEIESMKRIFKQLRLRSYGERRDFEGLELNYGDYMDAELQARVTKIRGSEKYFKQEDIPNKQRPVIGIHADASSSTEGKVIQGIRDAFFIIGNALSASDWNYGLYVSADKLTVVKDPTKKWSDEVNDNIMNISAGNSGIYLAHTSSIISSDLRRINGSPKCLIVLSDFEVCGEPATERKVAKNLLEQKVYPVYVGIGEEHKSNARDMTSEVGEEHYSVVGLDKLHELPGEIFRLFKTFGIVR
ncbi:MAG: hypothetical protein WCI72_04205 [archaeon]